MSETPEAIRQQFVQHIRLMVDYWANLPGLETPARVDGIAFSILTMLDGAASLPRFTVAAQLEDGTDVAINEDCDLHEVFAEAMNSDHPRVSITSSADKAENDSE